MARASASIDGRSVSDLLSALDLRGQCWCYTDLGLPAGFAVPRGEAVSFHTVIEGQLRIACASGAVAELRAGDAVMVLSGEAHALRTTPDSPAAPHELLRGESPVDIPPTVAIGTAGRVAARVLSGRLAMGLPDGASRAALPALLAVAPPADAPPGTVLRPEALAFAGMGAGAAALLTRLAALMLVSTLRADPRCRLLFLPPQRDPIAEALRLIESDPSADWTVERLARAVGMGRSNFAAHFSQAVGRAPMDVVARQRMEHAAALLREGRLKIAEISELAGYGSEAAFSRRFTRHFGITPSQMRVEARAARAATAAPPEPVLRQLLAAQLGPDAALSRRRAAIAAPPGATLPGPPPRRRATLLLRGSRE